MLAPCKECTNRTENCHSACELYIAFRAEIEKQKEAKYKYYMEKEVYHQAMHNMKTRRGKNPVIRQTRK